MGPRKHLVHAALLAVVATAASAQAAPPAPHVPAPTATPAPPPDKKVATPAPASAFRRFVTMLGFGKAPASKLPTRLDLRTNPGQGTAKPAAPEVAPREMFFASGTVDDAIGKLIARANETGIPHKATLNRREVIARPGDDRATVRKPYDDAAAAAASPKPAEAPMSDTEKARAAKLAALTKPLVRTPPKGMKLDPRGEWSASLSLLTPAQLKELPEGTVLRSIDGREVVVGVDSISSDRRGGFVAFGFDPRVTP